MFKKNSVQNANHQIQLNTVLSVLKYLQNRIGKQKFIKNISAAVANIFGTLPVITLSVCLI